MRTSAIMLAAACAVLLTAPRVSYADTVLTLNMEEAPIRKVVSAIELAARAKVAVHADVQGTISAKLEDVPWRQALDFIAKATGNRVIKDEQGGLRLVPNPAAIAKATAEIAAKQKRIHDLAAKAAKLVEQGKVEQAKRLYDEIDEIKKAPSTARKQRVFMGHVIRYGADGQETLGSTIHALRKDVQALRTEVRKLKDLVQKLLGR